MIACIDRLGLLVAVIVFYSNATGVNQVQVL